MSKITEMPQCRNFNCKYHERANVGCRLKTISLNKEMKCIYYEEKKPTINIENVASINRENIRKNIIPEIIAALEGMRINLKGLKE